MIADIKLHVDIMSHVYIIFEKGWYLDNFFYLREEIHNIGVKRAFDVIGNMTEL